MRILLIALSLCFVGMLSCTSDNESVEDTTEATTEAAPSTTPSNSNANSAENLPWTFLVDGLFHSNVTIAAGSNPRENPNEGHWIDFKENGTYDYGVYDQKTYGGAWHYDGQKRILQLTPDSEAEKRSEWKVMHKDDNLIWIGTSTYDDNAYQMQWLRREGFPSK